MTSPAMQMSGLQSLLAFFTAALLLLTWPLWSITTGPLDPQIPWLTAFTHIPWPFDLVSLAVLVVSLVMLGPGLGTRRFVRISLGLYLAGMLSLLALDQHRLQPWAWQFTLMAMLFLLGPDRRGIAAWRVVVISIYVWSAVSKFDAAFLSGHGPLLLHGLLDPLGIDMTFWSPQTIQRLALLFPLGELAVAILLAVPALRRWGLGGSLVLHALLCWTLGWGLRHEWGVLAWNAFFILQNIWIFGICDQQPLFSRRRQSDQKKRPGDADNDHEPTSRWLLVATLVMATYPVLELFGWCDHWPAWSVYSARPATVTVLIDEDAVADLPASLRNSIGPAAIFETRRPFSLEAWSYRARQCPVYPQLRYRLALALALLDGHVRDDAVTIEIGLSPNRWTGEREQVTLSRLDNIRAATQDFFWNTKRRASRMARR